MSEWFGTTPFKTPRASHAFKIKLGRMLQPARSVGTDIQVTYLNAASVQSTGLVRDDEKTMWASPVDAAAYRVEPGDLLVSEGGDVGRSTIVETPDGSIFQNSLHRVRPLGNNDVRFFRYTLEALRASGYLDELTNKATIRHLTREKLAGIRIPLPGSDEQRRIADFLDEQTDLLDALIRRRQRQLSLLEERRALHFALALKAAKIEWLPMKRLGAQVQVGIVVKPSAWYVASGGVKTLRGLDVSPGKIDSASLIQISHEGDELNRKSRLHAGDVVVVRTGKAGAACVVPPALDGTNAIDLLILRPGDKLDPRFVELLINSEIAQRFVEEFSVGTIQSHFNVGALRELPTPVLSRDRQESIVREVEAAQLHDAALSSLMALQVRLLEEKRQDLITAAVTGALDLSTARRAA